jgi:hypothetical protein
MSLRVSLLIPVVVLAAVPNLAGGGEPADSAVRGFERFAGLAGEWEGTSTKGWTERIRFQVIAKGSAVLETSFDAHPGETMATLFSLDRGSLELRHYCVAGNQPHLRATAFEEDGRRVTFTFVDGGNLASRDRGHMDKAVYLFEDADHVTARWTWYQDGKERWLEEIRLVRKS